MRRYAGQFVESRAQQRPVRCLWLAPHRLAADEARQLLTAAGVDAALSPGVKTIGRFGEALVSLDSQSPSLLPTAATHWLLKQVIADLLAKRKLHAMAEVGTRPGLAVAIEQMMGELKLRGVSSDRFIKWASGSGRTARDRELSIVYDSYQRQLNQMQAADHYDLPRLAVDSLHRADTSEPAWDLVVVDGFASFAYHERQLLLEIADRSHETWIALSTKDARDRHELTSTARRTLAWLAEERPGLKTIEAEAAPAEQAAGLKVLSSEIFALPGGENQEAKHSHKILEGFDVIAAADSYDEAITVARRIKRLLVSGVPAADIVVTMDSVASMQPRLEEVFATFGVPASFASPQHLADKAPLRAMVSVLALAAEDWPFRRVVEVLTTGELHALDTPSAAPPWRTLRGAAEWLVRDLQVASGRQALLRDVERLANAAAEDESPSDRAVAASMAQPQLALLSKATSALPSVAKPADWIRASESFAGALGINLTTQPVAGWQQVREAATWVERASSAAKRPTPEWTLAEWLGQLREWMARLPASISLSEEGCVRVYGPTAARFARVKHLFVMGLDEQSFSARSSVGSLYSDQQYDELVAADSSGKPLKATPAYERAMQLFYDVVRTPRSSLTISFAALDTSGQAVPPSPMLVAACRPFGQAFADKLTTTPIISALPPADKTPCSLRDWRLLGVHQAAEKQPDLLGNLLASPLAKHGSASLHDALALIHHRARGDSFGPLEGVLASLAARTWFAERFGAAHQWSTSQLETYALCPYRFLMQNVLRVEPLGDAALGVDYGRRGSLLHHVFGLLHQKLDRLAADRLPSDHDPQDFAAALDQAVGEAREQLASFGIEGVLDELLASEVQKWSAKYQDQHRKYDDATRHFDRPLRPAYFELRFGKASRHADDEESPASVDEPFLLDLGDGMVVRLGGRIDRVDVGQVGQTPVFQIIDYKSAASFSMKPQEVEDGRKLQPPLYAMAAAQLIGSEQTPAAPLRVGYWVLRASGFSDRTTRQLFEVEAGEVQPTDSWRELQPILRQRVRELVEGVRGAEFPMFSPDEKCTSHCDYSHVCRVGQARSLNKQWPPLEPEETTSEGISQKAAPDA